MRREKKKDRKVIKLYDYCNFPLLNFAALERRKKGKKWHREPFLEEILKRILLSLDNAIFISTSFLRPRHPFFPNSKRLPNRIRNDWEKVYLHIQWTLGGFLFSRHVFVGKQEWGKTKKKFLMYISSSVYPKESSFRGRLAGCQLYSIANNKIQSWNRESEHSKRCRVRYNMIQFAI